MDSFGNVTCESEEKDPGCKFQISVAEDGSGRWALRNVVRGYFLGSSSDKLTCTAKVPGDAEFWLVHLAARPQVWMLIYCRYFDAFNVHRTLGNVNLRSYEQLNGMNIELHLLTFL